ncbi:hypothetical protein LSG31_06080 [Fodinisporobacter ferrooxydans]|uniref:Endolytic transglycosylase MltG n=1 Tax=Fodinisporobacter ferrooxydans TaxID=2901836 RepID=A0ABY4CQW4_9BACL|nr:hypothetical protein LSG31_06080 [Alicyclobacillaceae bacterium MYW30-H2]
MDQSFTRNPLLQSVLYHSFTKACKELGYEQIQDSAISKDLCIYLRQEIESFPEQNEEARKLLILAIRSGEVIATEMTRNGTSSLLIRCEVAKVLVDVRLYYERGIWQVAGILSIHSRPFLKYKRSRKAIGVVAAVFVLGLGILVGRFLPTNLNIQQYAKDHGYVLLTVAQEQNLMKDLGGANSAVAAASGAATQPGSSHDVAASGAITFTMQQGMGTQDLTDFLLKNHLIKNGAEFNQKMETQQLDRTIQLGTYTFANTMTEDQILQTIKQGPHSHA